MLSVFHHWKHHWDGSMTNDVENWYMHVYNSRRVQVSLVHIDVESLDLFSVDVCNIIYLKLILIASIHV